MDSYVYTAFPHNTQNVINAVSALLENFHTGATGSPGNPGTAWTRDREWWGALSTKEAYMLPVSRDYTQPILRYITGRLGEPWTLHEDASNAVRLINNSGNDYINSAASVVSGENGKDQLHLEAKDERTLSDFILEKTEFIKDIDVSKIGENIGLLYDALTEFAKEMDTSGSKLISALRVHPLSVGGNLIHGLGGGFQKYLGKDAGEFFDRLKGKFFDWLLGSNQGELEGVQPPANLDLDSLAKFGFDVLQRVTHAQDLKLGFFKGCFASVESGKLLCSG